MTKWIREIERDLISFGSIIFYFLVIGRALVGPFWELFAQLLIAAILILIIFILTKNFDTYISRGVILAIFISHYYQSIVFSIFVFLVLIAMIISSRHLGNSLKKIILAIIIGIFCAGTGYLIEFQFIRKIIN